MKTFSFINFAMLLLAVQVFFVNPVAAEEGSTDAKTIERLERLIKEQQQQLEYLQQQLNELKQTADDAKIEHENAKKAIKKVAEDMENRVDTSGTAKIALDQPPGDKDVTSGGGERMKLSINGFVNRAVNIVDDGKDTDAYFVDIDDAESRVNFVGTARATDDLTLGTRIELAIAPNKSGNVSQVNQETGDIFEQRWVEASLLSKRFGKLSLGKGNVGAYGTTSVDLSRTGMISYSGIIDTAGGMLFRQTSDDALTDVRIGDASIILTGCCEKTDCATTRPHSMDSTSPARLSATGAMMGLCGGEARDMALRLPPAPASLNPARTMRAFNTAAPFQYCMRTPV
jgi:hypothetical protein